MDDTSQKTCPADRFSQTINDPAVRAAINLEAAVLYSRCTGLLSKAPSAQLPPAPVLYSRCSGLLGRAQLPPAPVLHSRCSGLLGRAPAAQLPPAPVFHSRCSGLLRKAPSAQLPPTPSRHLSSQSVHLRMDLTPPAPNHPSTLSKHLRRAPDQLPHTTVRKQLLSSYLGDTPAELLPSSSQLSSQPRYWTRENDNKRMDNSRERSRPQRTIKPIYRLQVGSNQKQTKYTETQFQPQQKMNGSKLVSKQLQVSIKLLKMPLGEQESVCPTSSKQERREPNPADDENNARDDLEEKFVIDKAEPSMMICVSDEINEDGALDLSETEGDTDIQATTTHQVNNNESKSTKNSVDQSIVMSKDLPERVQFNENVICVDHHSMATNGINQVDTGDTEPLEGKIGENNNNVPLVTTTAVKSDNEKYGYISRWVPFLRKRKLCIEGDLLKLDEEPNSMYTSRYFTSRILERHSDRRVATKNSLYALEGPLLIPDPATRPMPLFVIEKFKNGFPEDWKSVVDIWASFSDHRVIQNSVSQFDLARFSLCSSEIGSKIVNICAMTDGSLVANMAAVNGGNFHMKQVPPQCFSPDI